ncbi:MAG TPA: methyltransferase domain-containing protein [Propionibacteriaceae bacterium]|nr:methyltransferase domain-containing protein [Propionibacteriaceae bacterium]
MAQWDPARYLQFADERSRPFFDLTARIGAANPRSVVDLGCGPGNLTAALAQRWPGATVDGIDSSVEMIGSAARHASDRLRFRVVDLREWRPAAPVDVLVSNATLQWLPQHRELLPRLVSAVSAGGWFGFQVPANFAEPSHRLLEEIATSDRFAAYTSGVELPAAHDAATYLSDLAPLSCRVDAWETTYLHVLSGPDPVFRWISGTGARPVLQALPVQLRSQFEAEYKAALARAYPTRPYGTVLPFRRVFVVAQRN